MYDIGRRRRRGVAAIPLAAQRDTRPRQSRDVADSSGSTVL